MLRRRHINANRRALRLRSALSAAPARLRRVGWVVEDGAWRGGVRVRSAAEAARWPFERAAWAAERRVVWPLRERLAGRSLPGNAAGAAALAAAAVVALLAGALLAGGGDGGEAEPAAAPARVAVAPLPAKPAAEKQQGPTLQGVAPSFDAEGGSEQGAGSPGGVAAEGSGSDEAAAEGGGEAGADANGAAGSGEAAATSSAAKPVPAGREAMKAARRFSNAFVFYEVGEHPAHAKAVFGETASPQLAEALAERPPRLPQGARVPKARVVNLVPGPRRGRSYTISVSLLRLGVTSELRLSLAHSKAEGWRVVNVLG